MTVVQKRVLIGVGAVVALLLIGYLLLVMSSGSTARPGTTVQGVDISGMSQDEAAAAVEAGLGPIAEKRLRVRALDETFALRPEEAGLSLDAEASVAPAFGHTWNPIALVGGPVRLDHAARGRRPSTSRCWPPRSTSWPRRSTSRPIEPSVDRREGRGRHHARRRRPGPGPRGHGGGHDGGLPAAAGAGGGDRA